METRCCLKMAEQLNFIKNKQFNALDKNIEKLYFKLNTLNSSNGLNIFSLMQFNIITIFPKIFDSYINESILKIAQKKKKVKIKIHNLRDYTRDKHKTIDDRPYGGGAGMVLMVESIYRALKKIAPRRQTKKTKIILLSPTGKTFNQKMAEKFSKLDRIIFICGRYEGVDARVEKLIDKKISIGDYVLSGGELPALVITEAVTRLIPGVLGKYESTKEESFARGKLLEYPQYTRPETFNPNKKIKWSAPKILLSGNHQKIAEWREKHSKNKCG